MPFQVGDLVARDTSRFTHIIAGRPYKIVNIVDRVFTVLDEDGDRFRVHPSSQYHWTVVPHKEMNNSELTYLLKEE